VPHSERCASTFNQSSVARAPCVGSPFPSRSILAASNSEARKLIANNGLKLNDVAVSDPKLTVETSALNADGVLKLSSGKKRHVLIKPF